MAELVRHRQTKGSATDRLHLNHRATPRLHTSGIGLNPLDFLSATMKAGRKGMSLDWTQRDLHEGLRCFNSGAFFEAHEHWESVWLAAQEPEKTFLQGLIQVAAS